MSEIRFSHPALLLLLIVALPVVAAFWFAGFQRFLAGRKNYGEEQLVDRFSAKVKLASQFGTLAAWLTAMTLVAAAAAGPTSPAQPQRVQAGSLQVVAVFDVSQSMAAEDYRTDIPSADQLRFFGAHGSRLDEAKYVLEEDIMRSIGGNQVGIVTYKGNGFPLADPSDDFDYIRYVLDNLVYIGNAPGGGSWMADGLNSAIEMYKRDGTPDTAKVIVLFSDGGIDDAQNMQPVLAQLNALGIKLVIIGMGGAPVPIPTYDSTGQFAGYYSTGGTVPLTGIEEQSLQALAASANGSYIHVDPHNLPSINWPSQLASRSKVEVARAELYEYPLLLGIAIIVLLSMKGSYGGALALVLRRRRGAVKAQGARISLTKLRRSKEEK